MKTDGYDGIGARVSLVASSRSILSTMRNKRPNADEFSSPTHFILLILASFLVWNFCPLDTMYPRE